MSSRIRDRISGTAARALPAAFAVALAALLLMSQGCLFTSAEEGEVGVVRSEQAEIYSSTALVALKIATVKRGEEVEILKRESVQGPTYTEEWLNVRLNDDASTNGWIEARHVVPNTVVERAEKIAGTPEELPAFARGRLKVNQRLRLGPGRDEETAIVLKRGAKFDIIGKETSTYTPEKTSESAEQTDEPAVVEEPEEKTDTWYQVRLDGDSIIKGGWILGPSVSIEAPDEILHLEGDGRRFVAWQVNSTVQDDQLKEDRNNYATFMRRGGMPSNVDFERVYFLYWDPKEHKFYSPHVESDLRGVFPISQRQEGDIKIVTYHVLNDKNEKVPVEVEVHGNPQDRVWAKRRTPSIKGERLSSAK